MIQPLGFGRENSKEGGYMKKIYVSLGLPVFIFALAISAFLFKEYIIAEKKPYISGHEQFPEQAHTFKVDGSYSEKKNYDKNFSVLDLQIEDLKQQVDLLSKKMRESDRKITEMESEKTSDEIPNEPVTTETSADEN